MYSKKFFKCAAYAVAFLCILMLQSCYSSAYNNSSGRAKLGGGIGGALIGTAGASGDASYNPNNM